MAQKRHNLKIFLIRGLARETRHWGDFVSRLAKSFSGSTVHPLEIPGTGRLRHHAAPSTISGYVNLMRQDYLLHASEGDHCNIIGLSLGGMITAHWLKHHPHDFRSAVLINTSSSASPIFRRVLIRGAAQLTYALFCTDVYQREKRLASLLCNLADQQKVAENWAEIAKSAPVPLRNFLRQLYAAAIFRLPVTIETPTLILCSRKDRLVSYTSSEDIAALWHRQLLCHDLAGHDLTSDDPGWCIEQLENWSPFTST